VIGPGHMPVSGYGGQVLALAERYRLPASSARQLAALLDLVVADAHAPTTVRAAPKVLDDHLADSLVALELEPTRSASRLADLGAGAGFPGLPLAIALAHAEIALVESSARKCAFIERAARACELANVTVVHERAEAWSEGLDRFDLVTARALAPLPVVAEYAAPLLRIGGALIVWRGRRDPADEAAGARAAAELGLEPQLPVRVEPYVGAEHRHLQLMLKVAPTPPAFPRRPGMARKRPLG
jgi:16S rRNA (guanine527-N7)-methyltransferase